MVIRKYLLISIIVTSCLAGCFNSNKIGPYSKVDKPADIVGYLQSQDVRELESVEPWENEYAPGLKITTTHYEIFTTLLEPLMLRAIPGFVESAYDAYNSQLPEPIETTNKFTIYLFADRQQWEDFTNSFAGGKAELFLKIKAGAYYLNGASVIYNIGIERTFTALGHEGWHQYNSRYFKFRLPSWLDEGVATLFEAHKSKQGTFIFSPADNAYRLKALKNTLNNNRIIPLRELISLNPGVVFATDESEAVMAFYSQSYALARFLQEYGHEHRLNNFRRLLFDGLEGNWPLSTKATEIAIDRNLPRTFQWNRSVGMLLFKQYLGTDFDQIEKEYLAFCKQLVRQETLRKKD